MFYSIRGTLIHTEPGMAVLECAGIGYKCLTTFTTQRNLPKQGSETMLYTHLNVRDDAVELFGFSTKSELDCFRLLTGVSGVGPRVGLAILSELSAQQVAMAILSSDAKTITRAPGVGPKLSQRIILELKDKIKGFDIQEENAVSGEMSAAYSVGNIPNAVAALAVLGYSSADVTPILAKMDSSLTAEQLIAATLKEFGKQ